MEDIGFRLTASGCCLLLSTAARRSPCEPHGCWWPPCVETVQYRVCVVHMLHMYMTCTCTCTCLPSTNCPVESCMYCVYMRDVRLLARTTEAQVLSPGRPKGSLKFLIPEVLNARYQLYTIILPPATETLPIACIGQEVSTELELGHDCRVYG